MCPNILFYISAVSILLLGPFLRFYFVNILYFFSLLLFHSSNVLLALLKLLQFSLCLAVSSISLPVLVSVCSLQLFSCDWFSSLISAVGPPSQRAAFLHADEEGAPRGCGHEGALCSPAGRSPRRQGCVTQEKLISPGKQRGFRDTGQVQLVSDPQQIASCEPQFPHLKMGIFPACKATVKVKYSVISAGRPAEDPGHNEHTMKAAVIIFTLSLEQCDSKCTPTRVLKADGT